MSKLVTNKLFNVVRHENIGLCGYNDGVLCLLSGVPKGFRVVDNRGTNKALGAPVYIEFYPSFLCNFSCKYCFVDDKAVGIQPIIVSKKTIDSLIKYSYDKGIYTIYVFGGEPLLPSVIEKVFYLIEKSYLHGININLTTNGYFINSKVISFLKRFNVILNISLQGSNSEITKQVSKNQNAYIVHEKIISFVENKIDYGVSTNIIKSNLSEFDNLINFINSLKTCGAWVWRLPTIAGNFLHHRYESITSKDFFALYERKKEKIKKRIYFDTPFSYSYFNVEPPKNDLDKLYAGCNAGLRKITVLPNGDIWPCILLLGHDYYQMGNINYDINWDVTISNKVINCSNKSCKFIDICTGCPGYTWQNKVDYDTRCSLI